MDIKNLRCFLAVAENLNFSRAAESIFLSQPALSLRVNALESELGVQLFLRTSRGVYLTSAGSALLPQIQELVLKIDSLPDLARRNAEDGVIATGKLTLMLDDTLPEQMCEHVMNMFPLFCKAYPDISISVESVRVDEYESALLSGRADVCLVGLREDEPVNTAFTKILLNIEPMILAFFGDNPLISDNELLASRELLLLAGEERWNRILLFYLAEQHIKPKTRTIRGGPALCVNLLRSNTMTFMPKSFFDSLHGPELAYRQLVIPGARVLSTLIFDKSNLNPCLQLLINCCQETLQ